ncbi:MAG TPA: hypothetical protein VN203_25480, partial [Candidatus Acidoferrum sp.]|nr:hypothetical protein [Candidatus Acidoferrum sp.]
TAARMVAARPNKTKGIAKLSPTDSIHGLHNAPHGGARRGSEWIGLDLGDQARVVGEKDQLIGDR